MFVNVMQVPDCGHFLHTDSFANQLLVVGTVPADAAAAVKLEAGATAVGDNGKQTVSSVLHSVALALAEPVPTSFTLEQIRLWLENPQVVIQVPYIPPVVEKKAVVTTLGELTTHVDTEEEAAAKLQALYDRPFSSSSRPGTSHSVSGTGPGTAGNRARTGTARSTTATSTPAPNSCAGPEEPVVIPLTVPKSVRLFDYLADCGCDETIAKLSHLD